MKVNLELKNMNKFIMKLEIKKIKFPSKRGKRKPQCQVRNQNMIRPLNKGKISADIPNSEIQIWSN